MISSTGPVTSENGEGHILGEYEYDIAHDYYKQVNNASGVSAKVANDVVLFKYGGNGKWYVSSLVDNDRGWLRNTNNEENSVPKYGWQYADKLSWSDDPTLTVTEGGLTNVCSKYSVTGTGLVVDKKPEYLGQFSINDVWINGRPVYNNTDGKVLQVCANGVWCMRSSVDRTDDGYIKSVNHPMFPDNATTWKYYASGWQSASVKVKCDSY